MGQETKSIYLGLLVDEEMLGKLDQLMTPEPDPSMAADLLLAVAEGSYNQQQLVTMLKQMGSTEKEIGDLTAHSLPAEDGPPLYGAPLGEEILAIGGEKPLGLAAALRGGTGESQ